MTEHECTGCGTTYNSPLAANHCCDDGDTVIRGSD